MHPRQMKLGLMLPQAEERFGGATARWADMLAMARRAEDVGFDSVWTIDHLNLPSLGGGPQKGVWECWSLLAALAACTSRVELGPLVTPTSFRNPALLAKMADTVEEISGGRLILGLGAGWHEPEYRAMGLPYDHRVSRFEEALQIIHGLLHDGQIDFTGRYYQARECELRPRGPRPNGPPILIGSQGPRMLGLIAKYADQWNAFFASTHNSAAGVPQLRAEVDAACAAAGRDPSTLERNAAVLVGYGPTQGIPHDVPALTGSNEEITAALAAYAAEGIGHLIVYVNPMTLEGIERFQPVLEALKASA